MKAKELKEVLTVEDIINVMHHLGAEAKQGSNQNEIMFRTICHNGNSHKLYLYRNSKQFHCYSCCGQLDIINIVQNVKKMNMHQAMVYIGTLCGIDFGTDRYMKLGFGGEETHNDDWQVYEMFYEDKKPIDMTRTFKNIDESILNSFYKMYHPAFYEDGITLETQYKFGIRYDILNQRIIIPHRDENDNLIAIRCRNLLKHLVDGGLKYTPITYEGKLLSAHTSKYFYGLNFNKDNIQKIKKVILVESEKSVMQLDSIMEDNLAIALSSSSLSVVQVQMLKDLGVEEVIVAVDKDFKTYGSIEEQTYAMKIRKSIINKLAGSFNISILWDVENLLEYKDSPSDRGADVFWQLMNKRIRVE